MDLQEILAERLRKIRAERRATIAEFSVDLGIARSTLQSILRGTCNPRIDTLELIANSLDLTVPELLSEPEDRQVQKLASLTPEQRRMLAEYLKQIAELLEQNR